MLFGISWMLGTLLSSFTSKAPSSATGFQTLWLPSKSSWLCMFSVSGSLRGLAPALLVHVMLLGRPQVTLEASLSACSPGPPTSPVLSMGFTSAPCGSLPPSERLLLLLAKSSAFALNSASRHRSSLTTFMEIFVPGCSNDL